MDVPDTHYARRGTSTSRIRCLERGRSTSWSPGALSNIAYGWEFKSWRNFYGTLASFARVLLFDKRGTGISDPVPGAPSIEERMDDVRAVMDVAGSQRAALMGSLDGAAMAALFAATYPERVAGLILNNPRSRSVGIRLPVGESRRAEPATSVATWWGKPDSLGITSPE